MHVIAFESICIIVLDLYLSILISEKHIILILLLKIMTALLIFNRNAL